MNPLVIGTIGFGAFLVLLAVGVPIAFAAAATGFIGLLVMGGTSVAFMYIGTAPFSEIAVYTFTVLPLFIVMGHVFEQAGFAQELFIFVTKWVGRLPGGLAVATSIGGAGFGAACGSSVAAAAVLGKICIPEMERYNYDPGLASGSVASCANLAAMIPPSNLFVIFGLITEASIAKLLIAGILPGIMLTILFAIMIIFRAIRNPKLAPALKEQITWKDRLIAVKGTWGLLIVILVIMGGIYTGFFTPTEAGGVGVVTLLVLTILRRRLSWKRLQEALLDAGKTTSFVFFVVVGIMIFSRFLAFSRVGIVLGEILTTAPVPPIMIIIAMMVIYLVLGMFMDAISMLVLTLPIFYPIVITLGFDPIWFGVLVVLMAEIGLITPPVGVNCYVVHGSAPHIPLETVFAGIMPFVIMNLIGLALLIAFPQISLILPAMMQR